MNKSALFLTSITTFFCCLMLPANVVASDNLFIRLEQPKSPSRQNDISLSYVVLDLIGDRDITVTCNYQYEGGGLITLGSAQTVTFGGNTGTCHITAEEMNKTGKYTIYANAIAGADNASDSIQVNYNNDSPGTPIDYSKHIENCIIRIKFKTADDQGRTSKVEIYRSDKQSFTANDSTRITSIDIGSNTEHKYKDTIPDCNKTYYYALRAFSSNGNGSDIVSDKIIEETDQTKLTDNEKVRAIPMAEGSILGARDKDSATNSAAASQSGQLLGDTNQGTTQSAASFLKSISKLIWIVLGLIGIGLLYFFRFRRQR